MRARHFVTLLLKLFVAAYAIVFLGYHSLRILDYYRVSDDIRQQLYPLYTVREDGLFEDDLLTRYFVSHTPPLFLYAHYPLAWLIDPVILSKLLQLALLGLVLWGLQRIGRRLHSSELGWTLVFVCLHSPTLAGLTDGGLPRGWAAPGLILFVLAALHDRVRPALAAVVISAVFYPPVFLVLGPSYCAWSLISRRFTWWNLPAAALVALGFYPMVFRSDDIGHIVTCAKAAAMPEWGPDSRFPFVPIPSLVSLAPRYFTAAFLSEQAYGPHAWALVLLGVAALGLGSRPEEGLLRRQSLAERLRSAPEGPRLALGLPLFASLAMYVVSSALAFRLHIPDRNVKYSLPVLGLILIAYAAFRALERPTRWIAGFGAGGLRRAVAVSGRLRELLRTRRCRHPAYASQSADHRERLSASPPGPGASHPASNSAADGNGSAAASAALTSFVVIALTFWLGGSGLKGNLNLWADQRFAAGLYDFVATLPKDSLLAGPPIEMDNLPLFSRRKVYASDEAAQPLYDRYYAEISKRLRRVFAAYYAVEEETVREFVLATGVRYMVVRIEDFGDRFDRPKTYHEPYDSYVKSLKAGRSARDFWFAHPPVRAVVYEDRNYRVVDLAAVAPP